MYRPGPRTPAPATEAFVRNPVLSSGEFRRKILALLKNAEEQKGEQVRTPSPTPLLFGGPPPRCLILSSQLASPDHHPPAGLHYPGYSSPSTFSRSGALPQFLSSSPQQAQVQEAEEAGENPAPACKVKSHGKKSNLRRAFSFRKHGSKDSKRTEASGSPGAASPEARPSKRHSFLPMCVSGHRASISSGPGEQAWCYHGNFKSAVGRTERRKGQFSTGHPPENSGFALENEGIARSGIVG